ncbi:response regulator [Longitalea luteola]|uniref:response regulator n=1 Tax=Longitalea luteola TaxID=2812563 RepID=UPI001A96FF9C|nr:response regulator [Longitalea luteola]
MKGVTILLAEDNLVLGLFVKRVLQQAGYRVWFCSNTSEAWQYYADKNPDLVLLDNNQSVQTNLLLAHRIRQDNKLIPILFLSGKTYEEEVFENIWPQEIQPATSESLSEKKLLENLHNMLPVAAPAAALAPVYDVKGMKLCGPEDILILTSFFEGSVHLREYVPN